MSLKSADVVSATAHDVQAPATEELPPPENRIFYPALNGLRTIAVLLVFTAHYFLFLPPTLYWGRVGVDIFFVLSGFLITGILFDSADRPDRYSVFYKRRVLRIFPLYYFALLLALLMEPFVRWTWHPGLWLWPVYLGNYARFIWPSQAHGNVVFEALQATRSSAQGFTWNLDHFWSLCVEEQFYMVWPLLVYSVRDRVRLRNLCLATVIIVPLMRWICVATLPAQWVDLGFIYSVTPLRADSLLLGGAIALSLRGPEAGRVRSLVRPVALALVGVFAIWEIVSRERFGHFVDPVCSSFHNPFFATISAVLGAVLILASIEPGRGLYSFLDRRVLRAVGQRSYGFYVYHLLLYSVFRIVALRLALSHRAIAAAGLPLVALAGTLLVSWLSFRYLEAPLLRLKERWAP